MKKQTSLQESAENIEDKSSFSNNFLLILLVILSLAASGAAIAAIHENNQLKKQIAQLQQQAAGSPSAPAEPTPTPNPTEDWKTYSGSSFTIKYPRTWNIHAYEDSSYDDRDCIKIGSFKTDQLTKLHELDPEELGKNDSIQICYFPDQKLDVSFPYTNSSVDNGTVHKITVNGLDGVSGQRISALNVQETVVNLENPKNGYISLVLETGDMITFNQIVSTVGFIDENEVD